MRVYVTTSFVNVAEARHWLAQLRAIGITISHDWTEEGKSIQPPPRSETELPLETQRALAMADIEGIRTADVFWLLSPATGGVGCWFESGAAFWMSMNPGHGPKSSLVVSAGASSRASGTTTTRTRPRSRSWLTLTSEGRTLPPHEHRSARHPPPLSGRHEDPVPRLRPGRVHRATRRRVGEESRVRRSLRGREARDDPDPTA